MYGYYKILSFGIDFDHIIFVFILAGFELDSDIFRHSGGYRAFFVDF